MKVLYVCKTDPDAMGGVSEVTRQWGRHVAPRLAENFASVIAPQLTDAAVLTVIRNYRPSLVHLWAGQFPLATFYARSKGIPVVLDRSSTSARWQSNILREEAERLRRLGIIDMGDPGLPENDLIVHEAEYERSTVVTPTEFSKGTFDSGLAPDVRVVPTGADIEQFTPRAPPGEPFRVLFSGHNWFRKGLVYLWMAAKHLERRGYKDIRYEFNTGRPECPPFRLPALESTYSFTNRPTGLVPALECAHVMVLPTLEDSLPLSLDDAMAAGVPCITTPNAGSRVVDGTSGYIVPIRDPEALADKIAYLHDHRDEGTRLGLAGRRAVEQWGWKTYADALLKVYAEVVSNQR